MEHLEDKGRGPRSPESQVAGMVSVAQGRTARVASCGNLDAGQGERKHGANAKNRMMYKPPPEAHFSC